ncbi:MAG: SDR family oxidoreductase [Rhodospirillales bacterium]|jgi:NAD(P)-dependent dehydrogenase (short-subunit alcohol dehydrogenase family)
MEQEVGLGKELPLSVVITGGASGIGEAVVRLCVSKGIDVGIIDLNEEKGASLAAELGSKVGFAKADVCDPVGLSAAFSTLGETMPPITGCFTSAGVMPSRLPIEDHSLDDFRRVMDNHISGTFLTCKIVGQIMQSHGQGSIVTAASVLAIRPGPVLGYGAGKAAVVNLTQSLAVQWGKKNIRVNTICPGWVDTPFIRKQEAEGRDLSPITAMTPMGRFVKPAEIAELAYFLMSSASSAMTGSVVVADAGISLAGGYLPYGDLP